MRSVFTILMVLFALSASAQINNSQEVAPQDSVAVVTVPSPIAQDSVVVVPMPPTAADSVAVAEKPEVAKTETPAVVAEESSKPQPSGKATIEIKTHGNAGAIINKTLYNGPKKVKGFRIMVYTGSTTSARAEAGAARGRFSKFFSFPTYMFYESPYFKVTAGNFRTMEEAQRQLERVRRHFPKAFIVHEDISVNEFAK